MNPTLSTPLASARAIVLEAERVSRLDDRILALWQLDDGRKRQLGFPESILDEPLVPLSIVNNKLCQLAAFRGMDTPARARWVKANLTHVGCVLVPTGEAYETHGCRCELVRFVE